MPDIQRYPPGLLELLGMKTSGRLPETIDRNIAAGIDVTQLYGLQNIQNLAIQNAALAEAASVLITVPADTWYVLFAASINIVKTGTMGDGAFSIRMTPPGAALGVAIANNYLVTNTACADWAVVAWTAPYPLLLAPGTNIAGVADLVSTDASVDLTLRIRVGILN